jgi:PST family polysaccharide transporter
MDFIKKIKSSELIKVTSLNSIGVLVKMLVGIISSKVLAILIGPNGMALMGNFRNFLSTVDTVTSLGFQNGIVKYVVENNQNELQIKKIISTLFITILAVSFFCGFGLFFFADYWNEIIFGEKFQFAIIFKVLAIVLPLYIGSNYLLAIINGFNLFKTVIYINIIGSLLGLLLTIYLVYKYLIVGALASIIIAPILLFFVSWYFMSKQISLQKSISFSQFDFGVIKNLSHYFLMIIISGILGQIVLIAIRNNIINTIGLKEAGFWEAMTRISANYMLFLNTLLTVYYYPKLVSAENENETKKIIWSFYKNVIPFFCLGLIAVFFLRNFIVNILFTQDFEPVSRLFFWQLVGDFFKAISWILGLQFFAKKMTKAYILTDLLSQAILFLSSFYFITIFNIEGVVIANAFTYFMYLLVLGIYFRKSLV